MARNFAGGTDRVAFPSDAPTNAIGTVAFRMRTTQTTSNPVLLSAWGTTSKNGWAFTISDPTAGKIAVHGATNTGDIVKFISTTTVNDGSWHHVAFNWNIANGAACSLYVDGIQTNSGNNGNNWFVGQPVYMGDTNDTFWPSYVGELADVAFWQGTQLSAADIAALAGGLPPNSIRPDILDFLAPLVRDARNLCGSSATVTGTTVTDHPRIVGGAV